MSFVSRKLELGQNLVANSWKIPIALGVCLVSIAPVVLLYFIDFTDFRNSVKAVRQIPIPHIALEFQRCYQIGLLLPLLTMTVAGWFVFGKSVTAARLSWCCLVLVVLHLFWLSWGILAFYLANQIFVM
jgi:hypothetical protein